MSVALSISEVIFLYKYWFLTVFSLPSLPHMLLFSERPSFDMQVVLHRVEEQFILYIYIIIRVVGHHWQSSRFCQWVSLTWSPGFPPSPGAPEGPGRPCSRKIFVTWCPYIQTQVCRRRHIEKINRSDTLALIFLFPRLVFSGDLMRNKNSPGSQRVRAVPAPPSLRRAPVMDPDTWRVRNNEKREEHISHAKYLHGNILTAGPEGPELPVSPSFPDRPCSKRNI